MSFRSHAAKFAPWAALSSAILPVQLSCAVATMSMSKQCFGVKGGWDQSSGASNKIPLIPIGGT